MLKTTNLKLYLYSSIQSNRLLEFANELFSFHLQHLESLATVVLVLSL